MAFPSTIENDFYTAFLDIGSATVVVPTGFDCDAQHGVEKTTSGTTSYLDLPETAIDLTNTVLSPSILAFQMICRADAAAATKFLYAANSANSSYIEIGMTAGEELYVTWDNDAGSDTTTLTSTGTLLAAGDRLGLINVAFDFDSGDFAIDARNQANVLWSSSGNVSSTISKGYDSCELFDTNEQSFRFFLLSWDNDLGLL